MSNVTAKHYEWIQDDNGLTVGVFITTHWTRGDMMDTYLRMHRNEPMTKSIYEGEFMTIVEVCVHEEDARVEA